MCRSQRGAGEGDCASSIPVRAHRALQPEQNYPSSLWAVSARFLGSHKHQSLGKVWGLELSNISSLGPGVWSPGPVQLCLPGRGVGLTDPGGSLPQFHGAVACNWVGVDAPSQG